MADSNCNDGANDGPSKVKTKACRFFHTKRGCKFGYECQFLHSAKTSRQSGNVVNEVMNDDEICYEMMNLLQKMKSRILNLILTMTVNKAMNVWVKIKKRKNMKIRLKIEKMLLVSSFREKEVA